MKNKYLFLCIIVICFFISCGDYKKQSYQEIKNLENQQLTWLPDFIIDDYAIKQKVYNIYECHDLDSNDTWGFFSLKDANLILEKTIPISGTLNNNFDITKLNKLGCPNDFKNIYKINTESFVYLLIHVEDVNKFYFYGVYH